LLNLIQETPEPRSGDGADPLIPQRAIKFLSRTNPAAISTRQPH